jgi:hypothetical protein
MLISCSQRVVGAPAYWLGALAVMIQMAIQSPPKDGAFGDNSGIMQIKNSSVTEQTIEQWLLNLALEWPVWLGHLFPEVQGEGLNTRPIPHSTSSDCARVLSALFDAGKITLESHVAGDDVTNEGGVARVLDRFLHLSLDEPSDRGNRRLPTYEASRLPGMQVHYKLTDSGGSTWEKLAEPDWTRAFTQTCDQASCELVSSNRDLLMACMGWYSKLHEEEITSKASSGNRGRTLTSSIGSDSRACTESPFCWNTRTVAGPASRNGFKSGGSPYRAGTRGHGNYQSGRRNRDLIDLNGAVVICPLVPRTESYDSKILVQSQTSAFGYFSPCTRRVPGLGDFGVFNVFRV